MAEGDNVESTEKQNGQVNGVDAAAKKAAEANGAPLKDSSSVSMGGESDVSVDKRSRRRECIFINLAILLGIALVAVLVYFTVANALHPESPKPVGQKGGVVTEEMTTMMTTTTTAPPQPSTDAGFQGKNDPSSLLRNMPRGPMRRGQPIPPGDENKNDNDDDVAGQSTIAPSTTTEEEIDFSKIDRSILMRNAPFGGK